MADFPLHCGRLDKHDAHTWTRCAHLTGGWGSPHRLAPARDYYCQGAPLIEGGWFGSDAEDDAREERQIRDRREAS